MRPLVLLAVICVLVGCSSPQRIDRSALDQRYQETQLAPGVLSIVPMRIESDRTPPVVVNWWYAGTSGGDHVVVYRELTWDANGKPIGTEKRYRIGQASLTISQPFAYVKDASRWLPLYDVVPGAFAPPTDLPTVRQTPKPIDSNPIQLPNEPAVPEVD